MAAHFQGASGTPVPSWLPSIDGAYSPLAYGADPTGAADATSAIQSAMAAAATGGGVVLVPPGNYLIAGQLSVPANVQLVGSFSLASWFTTSTGSPAYMAPDSGGTNFMVTGNSGNATGTPAITLNWNSTLRGVCLYWPDQSATAATPTAYPWGVYLAPNGEGGGVIDCCLLNPYQGIHIDTHPDCVIERVYGQPISLGLLVESVTDCVRLSDVHFVPTWALPGNAVQTWSQANGTAFKFGRADQLMCSRLFALGYNIACQFFDQTTGNETGSAYGEMVACGFDQCGTLVSCPSTSTGGVRFLGGGMAGAPSGGGKFLDQSGGLLSFIGTGFWQANNALSQSGGTLMLDGCCFRDAATISLAGTFSGVANCLVQSASTTIALSGTGKATLAGNTLIGAAFSSIVSGTASGGTVSTGNN